MAPASNASNIPAAADDDATWVDAFLEEFVTSLKEPPQPPRHA